MFFEDVDLGWRLWLLGYRVRYVPESLVYHRHHALDGRRSAPGASTTSSSATRCSRSTRTTTTRTSAAVLPAALALAIRRGVVLGGDDAHALDLARARRPSDADDRPVVASRRSPPPYAVDALRRGARRARPRRGARCRRLGAGRDAGDPAAVPPPVPPQHRRPALRRRLRRGGRRVRRRGRCSPSARRILVATGDTLRPAMAGPAIRAWQIARALSREHDVELVTTTSATISHPDFAVRKVSDHELRRARAAGATSSIFQGYLMFEHPSIADDQQGRRRRHLRPVPPRAARAGARLGRGRPPQRRAVRDRRAQRAARPRRLLPVRERASSATSGSASSPPWAGSTRSPTTPTRRLGDAGQGRALRRERRSRRHAHAHVLKGVVPGIGADDKVILWGGGIYNWFDPLTLLRAVDKLRARLPERPAVLPRA